MSETKSDTPNVRSLPSYIVPSIVAGVVIAVATVVYFAIMYFSGNHMLGSAIFSIGLMFVFLFRADLFTGRVSSIYADVSTKKIKPLRALSVLSIILAFNIVGAVIFLGLYALSQPYDGIIAVVQNVVNTRTELSFGVIFVRGFLCNMFICSATYFSMRYKDKPGVAMAAILICVFPFMILGFEHSIVNFFVAPLAVFLGVSAATGPTLLWLLSSLLGNLVGGLLIAALYLSKKMSTLEEERTQSDITTTE